MINMTMQNWQKYPCVRFIFKQSSCPKFKHQLSYSAKQLLSLGMRI